MFSSSLELTWWAKMTEPHANSVKVSYTFLYACHWHQVCAGFSHISNSPVYADSVGFLKFYSILALSAQRQQRTHSLRTRSHKTAPTSDTKQVQVVTCASNWWGIKWRFPPPLLWVQWFSRTVNITGKTDHLLDYRFIRKDEPPWWLRR